MDGVMPRIVVAAPNGTRPTASGRGMGRQVSVPVMLGGSPGWPGMDTQKLPALCTATPDMLEPLDVLVRAMVLGAWPMTEAAAPVTVTVGTVSPWAMRETSMV